MDVFELKTELQKNPKLEIDDLVEQARKQCIGTLTECQKAVQQIKDGKPVAAATAPSASKYATPAKTNITIMGLSPERVKQPAALRNSQGRQPVIF